MVGRKHLQKAKAITLLHILYFWIKTHFDKISTQIIYREEGLAHDKFVIEVLKSNLIFCTLASRFIGFFLVLKL